MAGCPAAAGSSRRDEEALKSRVGVFGGTSSTVSAIRIRLRIQQRHLLFNTDLMFVIGLDDALHQMMSYNVGLIKIDE